MGIQFKFRVALLDSIPAAMRLWSGWTDARLHLHSSGVLDRGQNLPDAEPRRTATQGAVEYTRVAGSCRKGSPVEDIRNGKWCRFEILTQDGPLPKKVCQVTSELLALADECFSPATMGRLHQAFPPGTRSGGRMGAKVGSELHKVLYDLAVQAREAGKLEPRLKITRPTNQKIDPVHTRRGERSSTGPDFILTGIFDGEDIHAAWDFTTIESMASHYNRDILGLRPWRSDFNRNPVDPEVQQVRDTANFWTSYIVLFY